MAQKETMSTYDFYSFVPKERSRPTGLQDWLINNGHTYTHTATVRAYTPAKACTALFQKRIGHGQQARFVQVHAPLRLQQLGPGDVLVGQKQAWMLQQDDAGLLRIPYPASVPWRSYRHSAYVQCLDWSPDGTRLAASDGSGKISLHTPALRDSYAPSYRRHGSSTPYAVAWSPDGRRIASGGSDFEVHIWHVAPSGDDAGSILICRAEGLPGWKKITAVAWAPDGRSVFAGRDDGYIVQWHAVTGASLSITRHQEKDITHLAWSPDGRFLAASCADGTVRLWCPWLQQNQQQQIIYKGHRTSAKSVSWSPDGCRIVSAGEEDHRLHLWNPLTGEAEALLPLSRSTLAPLTVEAVAWSPADRFITAGCSDGTIQVVDMSARGHVLTYRSGESHAINTVAWSPDGWWLASGGSEGWSSGEAEIWQAGGDLVRLQTSNPPTETRTLATVG